MKNNLIEKITNGIGSLGKISKKIIVYGSIISFSLFFFSAILYYFNNIYIYDFLLKFNCIAMMKTSANIFAEVIIGGLIMDNLLKMYAE